MGGGWGESTAPAAPPGDRPRRACAPPNGPRPAPRRPKRRGLSVRGRAGRGEGDFPRGARGAGRGAHVPPLPGGGPRGGTRWDPPPPSRCHAGRGGAGVPRGHGRRRARDAARAAPPSPPGVPPLCNESGGPGPGGLRCPVLPRPVRTPAPRSRCFHAAQPGVAMVYFLSSSLPTCTSRAVPFHAVTLSFGTQK